MSMDTLEFPTLSEHHAEWGGGHNYIYGLYDPRDNELRYVGKSIRPAQRLTNHLSEHAKNHRGHWLAELSAAGLRPVLRIIDSVSLDADWQTIERRYIAGARATGCRLTNGTDGGDGVPGLSPESRAKIRDAWLGRKHRPESVAKMAAALRGRHHTIETRTLMSGQRKGRAVTPDHRLALRDGVQKLVADQVVQIRELLAHGRSQRSIAAEFGVHQGTISNIARGKSYGHIDGAS